MSQFVLRCNWPLFTGIILENGKAMFEKAPVLKCFPHLDEDEKLGEKVKEVYGEDTKLGSGGSKLCRLARKNLYLSTAA